MARGEEEGQGVARCRKGARSGKEDKVLQVVPRCGKGDMVWQRRQGWLGAARCGKVW